MGGVYQQCGAGGAEEVVLVILLVVCDVDRLLSEVGAALLGTQLVEAEEQGPDQGE